MKKCISGCAFVLLASAAQAQSSSKDFAAWQGIMFTPVGAFPGIEPSLGCRTDDSKQLAVRGSSWKFASDADRMNSLGVSYFAPPTSVLRYGATMGWTEPSSGDGIFLVGVEVAGDLVQISSRSANGSAFSADWKLSAGVGHFSGSVGGAGWSLVGQAPIKWQYRMASTAEVSLYAAPGFGVAGTEDSGSVDAEMGTRPMIGFGGAVISARGLGIHLGAELVPLDLGPTADSAPWVMGAALSFPTGGKD
jgi:hypothetical protein